MQKKIVKEGTIDNMPAFAAIVNKAGTTTTKTKLSQKDFSVETGLKGAVLKRAYFRYLERFSKALKVRATFDGLDIVSYAETSKGMVTVKAVQSSKRIEALEKAEQSCERAAKAAASGKSRPKVSPIARALKALEAAGLVLTEEQKATIAA